MGIQLVITFIVATLLHKVIAYISQSSIRGFAVCVCVGCTCDMLGCTSTSACLASDFQFEEV